MESRGNCITLRGGSFIKPPPSVNKPSLRVSDECQKSYETCMMAGQKLRARNDTVSEAKNGGDRITQV